MKIYKGIIVHFKLNEIFENMLISIASEAIKHEKNRIKICDWKFKLNCLIYYTKPQNMKI